MFSSYGHCKSVQCERKFSVGEKEYLPTCMCIGQVLLICLNEFSLLMTGCINHNFLLRYFSFMLTVLWKQIGVIVSDSK